MVLIDNPLSSSHYGKILGGCMNIAQNAFAGFTRFILVSTLLVLCSPWLLAQDATGRIVGTVSDPTGAVVPGVHVVVTNAATHVTRDTTTDASGYYQVLSLPVGNYTVSVDHKGFK